MNYTYKSIEALKTLRDCTDLEWSEITSRWNKKFAKTEGKKTLNALRKTHKRSLVEKIVEKTEPKILLYDIETAPIQAYVWGLWDNNVALNQIETDWYILSWSAKWLGTPENETMYEDQRNAKNIEDDSRILGQSFPSSLN